MQLVGGKSINVWRILCQERCNCGPLNQQGVRWVGSDGTPRHRPQQGQEAGGGGRDDLRPETLLKS